MVFTNYELARIKSEAISTLVDQLYGGFDSSTVTELSSDTTLTSELERFTIESITLNTTNGTYTVVIRIPMLTLNGETIRRVATFDASSSGNMGAIETLPSAYLFDAVHEVRVQLTITAAVVDIT